jgi:hypothetical protein
MKRRATPPLATEELARRCESYLEAVNREEYQFASGLKQETDLQDIEEAYADLASPQSVMAARAALEKATGEAALRLLNLLNFLIDLLMEAQIAPIQNRFYAQQGKATLKIQKKSLPFRKSQAALATEPDRLVRLLIGSEQHRVFARLNPLQLESLKATHQLSAKLNKGGHLALCGRRLGVDLKGLGEAVGKLLAETRDIYVEAMEAAARGKLGLALDDLRREDMAYLLGGAEFDAYFPAEGIAASAEAIQKGLGLDPTAGGRISYDLEDREGKSHRSCTYPIRVPDEIVVALRPKPGHSSLRQFLQQVGEAMHRATTDAALPFEFRSLVIPSVLQSSGHLFGRIVLDPDYLANLPGLSPVREALRQLLALKELYFVRLLATQFRYELVLHSDDSFERKDVIFSDMIQEHCCVRFAPEAFLFFTDFHFNSAVYLRGLMLESLLRRRLKERFGEAWRQQKDAGGFLRDFWKGGGRLSHSDALERLGCREYDFSPLVDDLKALFP